MRIGRLCTLGVAALLVASGGLVFGASAATAAEGDQIWYQSVGSPSAEAPCPDSSAEDVAKGWSPWVKGYEEWPNDGKGGWTCGRSILWAKGSPAPSGFPGCVQVLDDSFGPNWMNFATGYFLPQGSPAYSDAACTVFAFAAVPVVYATDAALAQARCTAALPGRVADQPAGLPPNIYRCYFFI